MTVIIKTIPNEFEVDGTHQKIIFNEPEGSLDIIQTLPSTEEVKAVSKLRFIDYENRKLILQNENIPEGNRSALIFEDELGVQNTILSSINGELYITDKVKWKDIETDNLIVNSTINTDVIYSKNMDNDNNFYTKNLSSTGTATFNQVQQMKVQGSVSDVKHVTTKEYVDNKASILEAKITNTQNLVDNNRLFCYLYSSYSTPLSINDHIQFDTVLMENENNTPYIIFDRTTAYTTTLNVASKGRFYLRANKTYKLYMHIGNASSSSTTNTLFGFTWFNATTGNALIETYALCTAWGCRTYPTESGNNVISINTTLYTVGASDIWVEIRPYTAMSGTSIFGRSSGISSMVIIEQLT